MSNEIPWLLLGSPDAVRVHIPNFSEPINNGPFLLLCPENAGAIVIEREQMLQILHYLMQTFDGLMRQSLFTPDPEVLQ